jgi:hypothetical protein
MAENRRTEARGLLAIILQKSSSMMPKLPMYDRIILKLGLVTQ